MASSSVTIAAHDVAVKAIVSPVGRILPGPVVPQALVRNHGLVREPVEATFWISQAYAIYQEIHAAHRP